jgi:hypothetical protein
MKCKNCKHWIPPKGKELGAVWGECHQIQDNDFIDIYIEHISDLSYGDETVQIDVHPEFGCILWEKLQ